MYAAEAGSSIDSRRDYPHQTIVVAIMDVIKSLSDNFTFRQGVAQTQSGHDVIHVAVDTLGDSGVLKEQIWLCVMII